MFIAKYAYKCKICVHIMGSASWEWTGTNIYFAKFFIVLILVETLQNHG